MLRKFLANVATSHQSQPRRMLIAYYNPVHADAMKEFQQIRKRHLPLATRLKFSRLSLHEFELYEIGLE